MSTQARHAHGPGAVAHRRWWGLRRPVRIPDEPSPEIESAEADLITLAHGTPMLTPEIDRTSDGFSPERAVRRVVVIGTGVAGLTAAEEIRRRHADCEIDLVGSEAWPTYNRTALPLLVASGADPRDLALRSNSWAAVHRVQVWRSAAVGVDRETRAVTLQTGQRIGYDRLILATGAESALPNVTGVGADGCFVLRDADDALDLQAFIDHLDARHAVVVGSGPLGVETADALRRRGIGVVLAARGRRLLGSGLDQTASDLVVDLLGDRGIHVDRDFDAVRIEVDSDGRVTGVAGRDGRTWACQLVVFATGTVPQTDLAQSAGLKVDDGIVVNEHQQTRDPAIFAVGDCAQTQGSVRLGRWSAAVEQATVAAIRAVGGDATFRGYLPVTDLNIEDLQVCTVGKVQGDHLAVHVVNDPENPTYVKLVSEGGFLVGAIIVGLFDRRDEIVRAVRDFGPAEVWANRLAN